MDSSLLHLHPLKVENRLFRLAARPVGLPKRSDWIFDTVPVPQPNDGEIVVRNLYLSLDPAMRGWMNEGKSYIPPVEIGEVMRAGAVGRVIASKHPKFKFGDCVFGLEAFPDALLKLFRGENADKLLLQVAPDDAIPTKQAAFG